MQMTVSEKEIEIERLLTTVQSLNAKVAVIEDTEADCANARDRFGESEHERGNLQQKIIITSQTIQEDNQEHLAVKSELIAQIQSL